jgi:heme oxygenase
MDFEPQHPLAPSQSVSRYVADGYSAYFPELSSGFSAAELLSVILAPRAAPAPVAHETLQQRLARETQRLRADLEASLPILAPPITEQRYLRYCGALWGFYAPLESKLRAVPGLEWLLVDLDRRWKAELLERDLTELGTVVPELALPVCKKLPCVTDLAQAFGAFYALELYTLGHRHIQRYLSHMLPSMTARASHYLSSYGADSEARWAALGQQIEAAVAADPAALDADVVVKAALDTLRAAGSWFRSSFAAEQHGSGARRVARASGTSGAPARASWSTELERALLRTWPQLGLSLPSWSELERTLLLLVPWSRLQTRSNPIRPE